MDLGVGSFVFSQGIVSALQLITDPAYLSSPIVPKLIRVTRKSFPIIALGLIRIILVKGTDYPVIWRLFDISFRPCYILFQEHETEYGRHWNFFITLALLPIFQVLLHPLLLQFPIALVGVILGLSTTYLNSSRQTFLNYFPLGQQLALSYFGLRDYLLFAPRTSLISANKEGIISLPGEKNQKYWSCKLNSSLSQVTSPFTFWGCLLARLFYHLHHLFSVGDRRCSSAN